MPSSATTNASTALQYIQQLDDLYHTVQLNVHQDYTEIEQAKQNAHRAAQLAHSFRTNSTSVGGGGKNGDTGSIHHHRPPYPPVETKGSSFAASAPVLPTSATTAAPPPTTSVAVNGGMDIINPSSTTNHIKEEGNSFKTTPQSMKSIHTNQSSIHDATFVSNNHHQSPYNKHLTSPLRYKPISTAIGKMKNTLMMTTMSLTPNRNTSSTALPRPSPARSAIPKIPTKSIYSSPFRSNNSSLSNTPVMNKSTAQPPPGVVSSSYEELLRVTLELDTAKQSLEREQLKHVDVQRTLQKVQEQNQQYQQQIHSLQDQLDRQTTEHNKENDALQETIRTLQHQLQIAQQEANDAIDICCLADEQKQHLEVQYQAALQTIQSLQEEQQYRQQEKSNAKTSHKNSSGKHVRFHDDDEYEMVQHNANEDDTTNQMNMSNNNVLVTYGKQLLKNNASALPSSDIRQRRQELRQRILSEQQQQQQQPNRTNQDSVGTALVQKNDSSRWMATNNDRDGTSNSDYAQLDTSMRYHHIIQLLQHSGQKLQLSDQRYFVPSSTSTTNHLNTTSTPTKLIMNRDDHGRGYSPSNSDSMALSFPSLNDDKHDLQALEALTKHYTTMVEVTFCLCLRLAYLSSSVSTVAI